MFERGNGFTDLSETASITRPCKQSMANFPSFSVPQKRSALAIFCRAPRLGSVKTRLAKTHGDIFAFGLYRAMLADTFDLGRALAPEVETFACFTPADGFEGENSLAELWDGPRIAQCEGDLGAKMLDCFAQLRAKGFEKIVIIGSDSPDLIPAQLNIPFDSLDRHDLVVAPTIDGGFYLIGASVPLPTSIFDEIVWSTADVYARLLKNLQEQPDLVWHRHSKWFDVDEGSDLESLRERLLQAPHRSPNTYAFLKIPIKFSPKPPPHLPSRRGA